MWLCTICVHQEPVTNYNVSIKYHKYKCCGEVLLDAGLDPDCVKREVCVH